MNDTNTETKGQFGEPWRLDRSNHPLGNTGDYEGLLTIYCGSDGVAECWNPEDLDEERFEKIVASMNKLHGHDLAAVSIVPTAVIEEVKRTLEEVHGHYYSQQDAVRCRELAYAALEKLNALKP